MKILNTVFLLLIIISSLWGQPNCNYFKLQGDIKKYEACQASLKAAGHYQFSKAYQEALDESIAIDSTFAYAYRAKSTAYLKSGDFVTWKELMDKAVALDPQDNLDYRGWCRFQFFRDYQGAIDDILLLKKINKNQIGFSVNGDYHLDIALALCYKSIGKKEEAISILENKLAEPNFSPGLYDHIHLGVLYGEAGRLEEALEAFQTQEKINDLAENRFYTALIYKYSGDEKNYKSNLEKAKLYYKQDKKLFDPYTEPIDKIYMADILDEEKKGFQNQKSKVPGALIQRYSPN